MSEKTKKNLEELRNHKIDEELLEEVSGGSLDWDDPSGREEPQDNSKDFKGGLSSARKKKKQ